VPSRSPISFQWRIANMQQVEAFLNNWGNLDQRIKARPVSMGSPLIYAGPIDRGYFLTGPRAGMTSRLRGPVHFMATAKAVVLPLVGKEVAARGAAEGPQGVADALVELAQCEVATCAIKWAST
jgi:hypothetical protein